MNDKRKALGRGMDSLLPTSKPAAAGAPPSGEGANEIALSLIDRNPYQTRHKVDEASLAELAASIRATGVIQPIVVRPVANGRFQVMAGERRLLASKSAGKTTIPAVVRRVSDAQAMEITIVENLQREDLNPMEQARAYERLSREFGLTQEVIAQRTGKDRASIANFMRLMKLPAAIQQGVETGKLSFGHAKVLLTLGTAEEMERVARLVEARHLSVRQTEDLVHQSGEATEAKARRPQDPNVKAAERELQSALGCKVKITDRKGRGKIVIEYATLEDFDRVVDALGGKA